MDDDDKYKIDKPYPKVMLSGQNNGKQVHCIMDDYSGKYGEITAITQYMYNAYICESFGDSELYDIFRGISIVEMTHHQLLGEAITTFDGDPVFAGNNKWWSGSDIDYQTIREKMIRAAIKLEEITIVNYNKAIACTTNQSLADLIERIIEDERLHLSIFKKQLYQSCTYKVAQSKGEH